MREATGIEEQSGELPAWRCWRLLLDGDPAKPESFDCYLLSHFKDSRWDGPVMEADELPTRNNTNGLYAAKYPDHDALPCRGDQGDVRLLGRVDLYGKVVEGETGYRAEKCVVRELWLVDHDVYIDFSTKLDVELVKRKLAERYDLAEPVHDGWPTFGGRADDPFKI